MANPFPALFDVRGVAADDMLNIRRDPSAGSPVIGTFPPDATGIEVMGTDASGRWALVNTGEQSGWTAFRFLSPTGPDHSFPQGTDLSCGGTEPFWTLRMTRDVTRDVTRDRSARFTLFDDPPLTFAGVTLHDGQGVTHKTLLDFGSGHAAVITRSSCDDGMSDRAFALTVDLILAGPAPRLYSGCCSIAPR